MSQTVIAIIIKQHLPTYLRKVLLVNNQKTWCSPNGASVSLYQLTHKLYG